MVGAVGKEQRFGGFGGYCGWGGGFSRWVGEDG